MTRLRTQNTGHWTWILILYKVIIDHLGASRDPLRGKDRPKVEGISVSVGYCWACQTAGDFSVVDSLIDILQPPLAREESLSVRLWVPLISHASRWATAIQGRKTTS